MSNEEDDKLRSDDDDDSELNQNPNEIKDINPEIDLDQE